MRKSESAGSSNSAECGARSLALPAECMIWSAESLRDSLTSLTDVYAVTLDASAVQRIDTVCLQLLTAFARERSAAQRPLVWAGIPAVLSARAQQLGLEAILMLGATDEAVRS